MIFWAIPESWSPLDCQALIMSAPFSQSLILDTHGQNSSKKLPFKQHFLLNVFSFFCPPQHFAVILFYAPHPCWIKRCEDVHFKGFSIIQGSISLRWKLHCWFKHPAASFSPSERFSYDDTCSNHWVMSLTDIKSPMSRRRSAQRSGG